MRNRALELAKQWLEKASHDLVTARAVLALPDGPTDTTCFHAQQAVEKALKALLTAREMRFEKVHDLLTHFDAALAQMPELKEYRKQIASIADYAVEIRYPGENEEPSRQDAETAVAIAACVVERIAVFIQLPIKSFPMATEFKVLPWLRTLRDKHAREMEGLTDEERLAALKRETHEFETAFRRAHPEAFRDSAKTNVTERPEDDKQKT